MPDKIKALGLAFAAVAAMSALMASAAQAGSFDFAVQPAVVTGQPLAGQEHSFSFPLKTGGFLNTKCPSATFEGTVQGQTNVNETTVTPTYGPACKTNGQNAVVRMNGCKYTITGAGLPAFTANVDIVGCTGGQKIEVEQITSGCIVTIGEQNNLPHVVFEQVVTDATAKVTLTGIAYTEDAKCPDPGHATANATLTGNTTARAFEDAGTAQVTKHNHLYQENIVGAPVTLIAT